MARRQTSAGPLVLLLLILAGGAAVFLVLHDRPQQGQSSATNPSGSIGPIRLATWNLKQFSDRAGIDLRTVGKIITDSHFDLLAIQEVKKDGREVDSLLNVLGAPWRATSFSPMTGNHERFVFLYHGDRLKEMSSPHLIEGDEAKIFDRVPYQAQFRAGQFDFTIISVHLTYTDTDRRRQEAQALARYAAALVQSDREKDIIIVGDFNEQKKRENLPVLSSAGWHTVIKWPTNLGSKEIFDHVLINDRYTRQFTGSAGVVNFDETIFANNDREASDKVSDHRPAYADFATDSDGD